jgi:hypothetical protein
LLARHHIVPVCRNVHTITAIFDSVLRNKLLTNLDASWWPGPREFACRTGITGASQRHDPITERPGAWREEARRDPPVPVDMCGHAAARLSPQTFMILHLAPAGAVSA